MAYPVREIEPIRPLVGRLGWSMKAIYRDDQRCSLGRIDARAAREQPLRAYDYQGNFDGSKRMRGEASMSDSLQQKIRTVFDELYRQDPAKPPSFFFEAAYGHCRNWRS